MASVARRSLAACDQLAGLANGTSVSASTWPSRKDTLASRPPWRKCVVGCGEPATVTNGAAMAYDSWAAGGFWEVAIRAESEKTNVVEVEAKSFILRT